MSKETKELEVKPKKRQQVHKGQAPFVATLHDRKQVQAMAGYGIPQRQIAVLVQDGISVDTLVKYFSKELERGRAMANTKVAQTLFNQAVGGNTAAAIFWAKVRMGWTEKAQIDITSGGEKVAPTMIEVVAPSE